MPSVLSIYDPNGAWHFFEKSTILSTYVVEKKYIGGKQKVTLGDMGEGGVKNLKKRGDIICERPLMVFSSHNKLFLYIFSQNVVHESQEEKIVSGILGKKFKLQYVEIFFLYKSRDFICCLHIDFIFCVHKSHITMYKALQ